MEEILESFYRNNLKQLRDVGHMPHIKYHIKNDDDLKLLLTDLKEVEGYIEIKFNPDIKNSMYSGWNYFDSGIRNWLVNGKRNPTEKFTLRKVNTNRTKVLQAYDVTWEYERRSLNTSNN
jgi:hypothetical protein